MIAEPRDVLQKVFGYPAFFHLQEQVVRHVIDGGDALVLMPTGGGKSLCFQVPALCREGLTLVVSPLLALMKDQVEVLQANGVAAAYLNSSQSAGESAAVLEEIRGGRLKLLYVSPEKLFAGWLAENLHRWEIALIAIDEAHCISFWGHDFRPEYTKLGRLREILPGVPLVALTATADPVIRRDILAQLGLGDEQVFQSSFDRPNLHLSVLPAQKRLERILDFLSRQRDQAGIIYCQSRAATENLAGRLAEKGYKARAYHAGLPHAERSRVQEDFLKDKAEIVCATVAFGMGIDKSNIRWVIHYNLPKNLEGFYQEIGRAGRDGLAADTLLFYSYADVASNLRLMEDTAPERKELMAAKLDRMKQYAEAAFCRRRVLLSYFGESLEEDCGNCDVCNNPPVTFDGTVIAQKILSAVHRSRQRATLRQVVLILRGSHAQEIRDQGWDQMKTFGAGMELKYEEWMEYGTQLINAGYLSVAYDRAMALHLTMRSGPVLKGAYVVNLVRFQSFEEKKAPEDAARKRHEASLRSQDQLAAGPVDQELLQKLKELRRALASELEVPPYVIFSDKSLKDMAARQPRSENEFRQVHGVGEVKLERFGRAFLGEIAAWAEEGPSERGQSTE